MGRRSVVAGVMLVIVCTTMAQAQGAGQAGPPQAPPTPPVTYKETVVVSASKTEQQLVDAPATMTVIGQRALSMAPASNYADVLRNVPGLNITQISARDINVTSRSATSSLATSQLAVLDGRSLYQDFFGFTMWDFMPANLDEIKRIEIIRGPASAVWGANALDGVVNVITKSPREMPGTTITIGAGTFNRRVGGNSADAGSLYYVRGTHSQIINDRWAYKLSLGTYSSDAFARPVGNVPSGLPTPTPYPNYTNTGTSQPKIDARFDYDFPDGERKLTLTGGFAGTDGIMHSGIGPFDIDTGTTLGYWKVNFTKQALKFQAFMNILDGKAGNLLSIGPDGKPIGLVFKTKTFDAEIGDTKVIGTKNALTYGGNLRVNRFELTIAPGENSRTEGGFYVQDEFVATDMFRIVAGARVDKFSSIDKAVFSPRVALVIKPKADQSLRVSYNRAFRAPSMVNNNLDITIATPLPLAAIHPGFGSQVFLVPSDVNGNTDLTEEHIDAFEVSYTGNIRDRATVSAAWYYTSLSDGIFFTLLSAWTSPPPGFPGLGPFTPAQLWGGLLAAGIAFPQEYTYRNLGETKNSGIELGLDATVNDKVSAFANYAFRTDPEPSFPGFTAAQALKEINLPSKHLFNVGISYLSDRFFGTLTASHASEAFWQDVLDDRFHGTTKPFTIVNATLGVKVQNGRYQTSIRMTNLGNRQVMQHVFGDVTKRQIAVELRMNLPK